MATSERMRRSSCFMALSVRTARLAFALPTKQIHHIWFGYSRLVILRLGLALGSARGSSHVGASACPRERDSRRMRADAVLTAERVLCAVPRTRGPRGLLAVPTHRSGHKCDTKIILPMKHFSSILEHNEPDINERTARAVAGPAHRRAVNNTSGVKRLRGILLLLWCASSRPAALFSFPQRQRSFRRRLHLTRCTLPHHHHRDHF